MKKLFVYLMVLTMVLSTVLTAAAIDVPTNAEYNAMSGDELLELAKAEGGKLVVYSTTSKMAKIAEAFTEEYPEFTVEVYDLDAGESITKVVTEVDTGNIIADVIQDADARGDIAFNYYGKYLEAYYPDDICAHIDESLKTYGMPFYTSLAFWYYNTDAFPEGAPVNNWWDIIELDENGNQKYELYSKEIGSESTYLALFSHFVSQPEDLAAAYEEKYGEPIEYTYPDDLGFEEENAGYEYLYRLSQLRMTFIGDGDEIVEAVANSTADKPVLGLASAGKIGNRDDNGWPIAWVTELAPYVSGQNTNYSFVVPGSDNPALARFFIRYMMGGDDGSGEGYKKVMKEGAWSVRDDYNNKKNPFSLAESGTVPLNMEGIYDNYLDVSDFWTYWHDKSPNK